MSQILRQKAATAVANNNLRKILINTEEYQNYQFLQKSIIPTMHFQKSLPRLPIPKLELTCERYLAAQRPLLIDEAFRKTEANVIRFRDTVGQQLQEMLKTHDKNNKHTSYISEPWFDMYLRDRRPLPIHYNPMLVMNNDENLEYNDQLIRATNLIVSSLRFYKSLLNGMLEPEVFHLNPKKSDTEMFRKVCSNVPPALSWYAAYLYKAYPLDMSQYHNLFNTTRIPETDKDRIFSKPGAKHITVQHKGHFYAFNVLDEFNDVMPAEKILARLKFIINDDVKPAEFPVGVLTTMERNKWATVRHLLADIGNNKHLKIVDSSLFNVCLDDNVLGDDPYSITRSFLHSDGKNRWFDKSFSLALSQDGIASINFEHSWGDGVAVLRYLQDIYKDSRENPQVNPNSKPHDDDINEISRLDFILNDGAKAAIKEATADYEKTCNSLDINYLIFNDVGRDMCKRQGVSPDAIMQLAFQVAYHKMTGKFVATYESCSTAAFKHGRTETIRPNTIATKAFTLSNNSTTNRASNGELKQMIYECSKVHSQLTREAAMGQGFDRHLFILRKLSEKHNIPCNIFNDPDYDLMNYNVISTSTLGSPAIMAGGFGPVVPDGLGLGYIIRDDLTGVLLTTYKGLQDGPGFVDALKLTFEDLLNILESKK